MNDTDLSDEAFWKWELGSASALEAWRECRRRSTAQVSEWMIANHWVTGHGDDITDLLTELSWQIEEAGKLRQQLEKQRREAFEAGAFALAKAELPIGYVGPSPTWLDEAYRAFLQERERLGNPMDSGEDWLRKEATP